MAIRLEQQALLVLLMYVIFIDIWLCIGCFF